MDTHSQYNTIRYRACTHNIISLKCMQTHVNTAYLHLFFMKSSVKEGSGETNDLHPVSHLTNESTISDCQPKPSDQEVLDVNVSNESGSSKPVCTMFMR